MDKTLEPARSRSATPSLTRARMRGRPTRERAHALRSAIIDAALDVFLARGFQAASMEGIARQANVAKITLYRHFESKEQLFVDVARAAQLRVRNSLDGLVEQGAPLDQVLRDIIERLYDGYTDPRYLAVSRMVIAEAARFPKLGRALLSDAAYVIEPLVAYLQHLKDRGQIDIESAYDAATQIAGLASGAGRYGLIQPSRHPLSRRRWVESLVTLFVRAWRVERA